MLVRAATRLILLLGLALAAPAMAQQQIPLDYTDANTIERADPDKPADLRAREEAAAQAAEDACAARDAAGCAALGKAYFHGEGKPQNRPAAEVILRHACDAADAEGCLWLGALFWSVGKPEPAEAAIAALERGCRLGSLEACARAADAIESGTGIRDGDQVAATQLRRDACAKGGASACRALGISLERSDDPATREEGLALLERQCRSGDGEACSLALSPLRQTIPPRTALAREMADLGCRAEVPYLCREYGDMLFAEASGPPESRTAALALFDRACALASLFCTLPEQIRARPALVKSCGRGVQADCIALGRIYSLDPNSPLHSPTEAMMLLGTACETGAIEACSAAVNVIYDADKQVTPDDAAQMVRWHETGCTGGSTFDCTELGRMLLKGDPFPSDRDRGYALLAQLCEAGKEEVCRTLDEISQDDPDAPIFVADSRFSPPISDAEAELREREERERRAAEVAALRERACTNTRVIRDGVVYTDRICSSIARMINGFTARPGQAPWQALLWRPAVLNGRSLSARERVECGGALIREGWILTAAHCVVDKDKKPLIGKGHRIRLGVHKPGDEEGISYPILRAIPHPTYHQPSRAYDIALIQIDTSAASRSAYPGKIARIQLDPLPLGQRPIRGGMPVYTFGWGLEKVGGQASDVLKGAKMQLEDPAACTARTKFRGALLQDALLCASAPDRSQACNGDSGGPLVTYGDGKPTVIGVVSAGDECGATGIPSRYTRVAKVRDWIEDVLAGLPPERRRR
ncbi:MAG: trypsin-like serine protease [Erythrobacter sp.]|nr:trypsin-like serine protease [Erythrobacter sp.]